MTVRFQIILLSFLLLSAMPTFGQNREKDTWLLISDTAKDEYGYINQKGDTVIPLGKYNFCFSDTFRYYAIVQSKKFGIVAIDRRENILYNVFVFDNGPDYPSDGLFRIIKNKKIGYADEVTGKVIIKPRYGCAYPFENGKAKVGVNCSVSAEDAGHHTWETNEWHYIDKNGRKISPASSKE